ncbi:uncharacterized protein LTR77_005399 [Saxophila tyrrhenica]|uniref:Uncharacterized protein n=1 Tax=Saxophila tyrrhenica TaxID=1690608 RepID=A0AAV9P8T1_9PEZI|nr:hypothetical protein LTR77_005399 [Saxophila tyrrhenica]
MANAQPHNIISMAPPSMPPPYWLAMGQPTPLPRGRGSGQSTPYRTSRFSEMSLDTTDCRADCSSASTSSAAGNASRFDSVTAPRRVARRPYSRGANAPEVVHPALRAGVEIAEDEAISPRTVAPDLQEQNTRAASTAGADMFRFGAGEENAQPASGRRWYNFGFGRSEGAQRSPAAQPLRRKGTLGDLRQSVVDAGRNLVAGVQRSRPDSGDSQADGRMAVSKTVRVEIEQRREVHCTGCQCHSAGGAVQQPATVRGYGDSSDSLDAATMYSAAGEHPVRDGVVAPVELPLRVCNPLESIGLSDEEARDVRRSIVAAESDEWPESMDVD